MRLKPSGRDLTSIHESAAAVPQFLSLTPRSDTVFNNDKIIHSRRTDFTSFESNKFEVIRATQKIAN